MLLNGVCVASVGLNNTEYYKLKSTGSDLDRISSDRSERFARGEAMKL